MTKRINLKKIKEILYIIIGTTLLAISINTFFEQQKLITGGVSGLAIIIKAVSEETLGFGIPLWATNLLLNIPLFIIGIILKGRLFAGKTLFSTVYLSFALYYTKDIPVFTDDLLLSSLFGGIIAGGGLGLVFSAFATTGGTDLAASIIKHYLNYIPVGKIMLVLDAMIILAGFFIFGAEKAMYAIISVYVSSIVIDNILEGIHYSKAAFIISEKYEQISGALLVELDRGVTGIEGTGMYTNRQKKVLFCIVSKKQIVELKDLVRKIDKKAFIIVADVREVLGEGFKEYNL